MVLSFVASLPTLMSLTSKRPRPPPAEPPDPPHRRRRLPAAAVALAATAFLLHPSPPTTAIPTTTPHPQSISRPLPRPHLHPTAEAEMMARMGVAIACGAIIGIERRAAAANAGVRTLSLVSLGSAIFSLTALHGLSGDPSRMGAAISTGIGFLGSGAINGEGGGSRRQLVTAASIWIAAALGVAAAAGLFKLAVLGAIFTVFIMRWQLAYRSIKNRVRRFAVHSKPVGRNQPHKGEQIKSIEISKG